MTAQLGHGNKITYKDPQFVRALHGVELDAIECGAWSSAALAVDGTL